VLAYLGQAVLAGVALSLGLDAGYTADPTILFRIFHYPPSPPPTQDWGVGEHTDYGLVTLLAQDDSGGLQIAAPEGRLSFPFFLDPGFAAEVPPLPDRAAAGDDGRRRWDGVDLRAFTGTYGDYLLGKVSKVFPQLRRDVLE
jgi:isopenicillin N synthase-like dioxygenase